MHEAMRGKSLFLLDMDGTIYLGDALFPFSLAFLDAIERSGGRYMFITNNSSKSVDRYVEKLGKMGIKSTPEDFYTSSQALCAYLSEHPAGKLYVVGTQALIAELDAAECSIVHEPNDADTLIIGYDTELTYEKLYNASLLLTRGAGFIATNPDLTCPTEFGFVPDCGSFCQMLYNATGRTPHVIGKPKPDMILSAITLAGKTPAETVVIGDRLHTDIASAVNAGVDSVLVLTGESTREDVERSEIKPTWMVESVENLI